MLELKRKIYERMLEWKNIDKGSTALLLEGARRVGKSYIAEQFGKQEYKSYLLIDFSNISGQILDVFENDFTDYDIFFSKLSVFYGVRLFVRESLIIFDEVQMYPKARQMIKHLVADGRYDYLETGSLITLKQNVEGIVLPSEEEHLSMHPMDFEEFLWAMGDEVTVPYIKECFEKMRPVGEALHRKIMNMFRQYMLVGGMPQAVLAFMEKQTGLNGGYSICIATMLRNLQKDMRVKSWLFLMVFHLSFPNMKRNIHWPPFRKKHVLENMKMPLCGWMRQ